MKERPRVFIGSSSEGRAVLQEIVGQLKSGSQRLDVKPWDEDIFAPMNTYIESLEQELDRADYAVFVLTPDDFIVARGKAGVAPRDNVIFELGLFMGKMGRRRCLLVFEKGKDELKIPSDLLGVKPATYSRGRGATLSRALASICRTIAARAVKLGPRHKLTEYGAIRNERIQDFCARITGAWWERIESKDQLAISFFRIEPDEATTTVKLEGGEAFDSDGQLCARWWSVAVGIKHEERQLVYAWEGTHALKGAGIDFAGFGDVSFEPARGAFTAGHGRFADTHRETHRSVTNWKSIVVRRAANKQDIKKMTAGTNSEKARTVRKVLAGW